MGAPVAQHHILTALALELNDMHGGVGIGGMPGGFVHHMTAEVITEEVLGAVGLGVPTSKGVVLADEGVVIYFETKQAD